MRARKIIKTVLTRGEPHGYNGIDLPCGTHIMLHNGKLHSCRVKPMKSGRTDEMECLSALYEIERLQLIENIIEAESGRIYPTICHKLEEQLVYLERINVKSSPTNEDIVEKELAKMSG